MRLTTLAVVLMTATLAASDAYPPPRFTDPWPRGEAGVGHAGDDRSFGEDAVAQKIPGMISGVVIDGKLAHLGTYGVRAAPRGTRSPRTPRSATR